MSRLIFNILIWTTALGLLTGIVISIGYAINYRNTEGFEGNLFDLIIYTLGSLIGLLYSVILKNRFTEKYGIE